MADQTENYLIDAFAEAIAALPAAQINTINREVVIEGRRRIDALVEGEIAGVKVRFIVEAKRDVFPRDVPEAIWQLRRYEQALRADGAGGIPMLVSNALSKGARDILREEGIGFFDAGGTLFVPAPGAYIFVEKPPPRKQRDIFTAIFQGKRAQVLHAVWAQKDTWLTVKDIAELAGVTPATASNVLSELERRDWVDVEGRGPAKRRRLIAPGAMLDAWQAALATAKPLPIARYYVPSSGAEALAERLSAAADAIGADYAVTGELAAQALAPYLSAVSQVIFRAPNDPKLHQLLADVDVRPVREGWNLGLIEVPSKAELALGGMASVGQGHVVSLATPLQIWLDLLQLPGRARDMADHFRREELKA